MKSIKKTKQKFFNTGGSRSEEKMSVQDHCQLVWNEVIVKTYETAIKATKKPTKNDINKAINNYINDAGMYMQLIINNESFLNKNYIIVSKRDIKQDLQKFKPFCNSDATLLKKLENLENELEENLTLNSETVTHKF